MYSLQFPCRTQLQRWLNPQSNSDDTDDRMLAKCVVTQFSCLCWSIWIQGWWCIWLRTVTWKEAYFSLRLISRWSSPNDGWALLRLKFIVHFRLAVREVITLRATTVQKNALAGRRATAPPSGPEALSHYCRVQGSTSHRQEILWSSLMIFP